MTMKQVRQGRELQVIYKIDLRNMTEVFVTTASLFGSLFQGLEVCKVPTKNGSFVLVTKGQYRMLAAARDYYLFRVGKWWQHRAKTERELAQHPKELRKKLRAMNFQVL